MAKFRQPDKKITDVTQLVINGRQPKKLVKKVQIPKEVFTAAVLAARENLGSQNEES